MPEGEQWYGERWGDREVRLRWVRFVPEAGEPGVYIEFWKAGQVTKLGLSIPATGALIRALKAIEAGPLPQYVADWLEAHKAEADAGKEEG